jgi:hypothetical protein
VIIGDRVTLEPLLQFSYALDIGVRIAPFFVMGNRGQDNATKSPCALPGQADDERSPYECLALQPRRQSRLCIPGRNLKRLTNAAEADLDTSRPQGPVYPSLRPIVPGYVSSTRIEVLSRVGAVAPGRP